MGPRISKGQGETCVARTRGNIAVNKVTAEQCSRQVVSPGIKVTNHPGLPDTFKVLILNISYSGKPLGPGLVILKV